MTTSPTRSALYLVLASVALSGTAMFVKLAGVNAGTAAFLRCAIAVLCLAPLARWERHRAGALPRRLRWYAIGAGALLGTDYVMWSAGILDVGAGIATVLVNIQVIVFPAVAWLVKRAPVSPRFLATVPVMLTGVALAGGALSHDPTVTHMLRGTLLSVAAGIAYSGYLYLNRRSGQESPRHVFAPVGIATATAAAVAGVLGAATTGIHLPTTAGSWGWVVALAVLGQVLPWVLVGAGTPGLRPDVAAALLLLAPIMAVILGMLVLREPLTTDQLIGCAAVVAAVWFTTRPAQPTPRAEICCTAHALPSGSAKNTNPTLSSSSPASAGRNPDGPAT